MKNQTTKKLFHLHSWVGIVSGILLFVIAFTGAFSVFGQKELQVWADPSIRGDISVKGEDLQKLVMQAAQGVPPEYLDQVMVYVPGQFYPDLVMVFSHREGKNADGQGPLATMVRFDPGTFEKTFEQSGLQRDLFEQAHGANAADFIVHFHADLHLGKLGLILTGTLGLTLMASIVTGVIIHRKILSQLFTFRPQKSFSLALNDGHKQMGVWGVLFHGVIGFTGAFLGLATVILIPAAAFVSFEGDQDKLFETFDLAKAPVVSGVNQPTQLGKIFEQAASQEDVAVTVITTRKLNDQNALVYVNVEGGSEVARQVQTYKGATAEFVRQQGAIGGLDGVASKILDLMFPLHFGNFGGVFVKIIWTVLGLSTALLPLTGLMLWVERGLVSATPRFSHKTYDRFNRVLLGSCGGIVLACITVFHAQMIGIASDFAGDMEVVLTAVFYGSWIAGIGWGLVMPNLLFAIQGLIRAVAVLCLAMMPVNALVTGSHLLNVLQTGHYTTMWIDLTFAVIGVLLWRAAGGLKISQLRPQKQQASQKPFSEMQTGA